MQALGEQVRGWELTHSFRLPLSFPPFLQCTVPRRTPDCIIIPFNSKCYRATHSSLQVPLQLSWTITCGFRLTKYLHIQVWTVAFLQACYQSGAASTLGAIPNKWTLWILPSALLFKWTILRGNLCVLRAISRIKCSQLLTATLRTHLYTYLLFSCPPSAP